LKSLNNSQNMTVDFLQEIILHKSVGSDSDGGVVWCYGISQNPHTKDYVIVMDYMEEGDDQGETCDKLFLEFCKQHDYDINKISEGQMEEMGEEFKKWLFSELNNKTYQQAEEDKNRQLREAELEHNPEVHEAEAKTGACEKCKSSNQVIFEPKLKKVNPIGQEVFTNYLCADCYCQEEGIKPNRTPTNNQDHKDRPSPSVPIDSFFRNSGFVSEGFIDNNSKLSSTNKEIFKAIIKVRKGEEVDIESLPLPEERKQELRNIRDRNSNKLPIPIIEGYTLQCVIQVTNKDKKVKNKGLPDPVKGIIVVGVIGLSLKNENSDFREKLERQRLSNGNLKEELSRLQSELEESNKLKGVLESICEYNNQEIKTKEEQIQEREEVNQVQSNEIKELEEKIKINTEEKGLLQKEINILQSQFQEQNINLQEQVKKIEKEIATKAEEITNLNQQIAEKTKLGERLEEFQVQLVFKEKELEELRKKCKELEKSFSLYLELINKYKKKQVKAENLVFSMRQKGVFDEKLINEFSQIQLEVGKLERRIETIIEEEGLTKRDLIEHLRNEK
ncbi:9894_t:CDS:2, partial [Cetraspora pellucida]